MVAPPIQLTALDLGLESFSSSAVRLRLEAPSFGVVLDGEVVVVAEAADADGVLVLNQPFVLELREDSALRAELARALVSDDVEDADVHLVVHSCDDSGGGAEELASGFLSLRSLLGTADTGESDHTLQLVDERGAVAGALSVAVDAVPALHHVLASSRAPLAPAPHLEPAVGGGGEGEPLVRLACGELQLWPEASRSAASLGAETLFLALELAVAPADEAAAEEDEALPPPAHESRSVRLRRRAARFNEVLSLRCPRDAPAIRALCAALAPSGVEQDADLFVLLLAESERGAREVGSAYVNLRELLQGGADWEQRQLRLVASDGGVLGALSCSIAAHAALAALVAAPDERAAAAAPPTAAAAHDPGAPMGATEALYGGCGAEPHGASLGGEPPRPLGGRQPSCPRALCSPRVGSPAPCGGEGGAACTPSSGGTTSTTSTARVSASPPAAEGAHGGCGGGSGGGGGGGDGGGSSGGSAALDRARAARARRLVLPPLRAPHRAAPSLPPPAPAAAAGVGGVELTADVAAPAAVAPAAAPELETVEQRRSYLRARRDVLRAGASVTPVVCVGPDGGAGDSQLSPPPVGKPAARAEPGGASPEAASRSAVHRALADELGADLAWRPKG